MPDNLATGVERPDLYDPKLNRAYGDLAAHYELLIDPARVRISVHSVHPFRLIPYSRFGVSVHAREAR